MSLFCISYLSTIHKIHIDRYQKKDTTIFCCVFVSFLCNGNDIYYIDLSSCCFRKKRETDSPMLVFFLDRTEWTILLRSVLNFVTFSLRRLHHLLRFLILSVYMLYSCFVLPRQLFQWLSDDNNQEEKEIAKKVELCPLSCYLYFSLCLY